MSSYQFRTQIETEILGELEASISFDYQPEEPEVLHPIEEAYPGCAEEFSVTSLEVLINDNWHQVMDLVPEYYHDVLEDKCRESFNEGED